MEAHMRISVKEFRGNQNLKIQAAQVPFTRTRYFLALARSIFFLGKFTLKSG
jgi:hypothetical protein